MTVRHGLVAGVAAFHLILVAFGAAEVIPVSTRHAAGQTLEVYRELSGADNSYGFFAPSVASQLRARFILTNRDGDSWCDGLSPENAAPEVRQRLSAATQMLSDRQLRSMLASSLAAAMFARNAAADQVVVQVDVYVLPTLAEYQAGARPRWVNMYEATFTRTPEGSTPEER